MANTCKHTVLNSSHLSGIGVSNRRSLVADKIMKELDKSKTAPLALFEVVNGNDLVQKLTYLSYLKNN